MSAAGRARRRHRRVRRRPRRGLAIALLALAACAPAAERPADEDGADDAEAPAAAMRPDPHSRARPHEVAVGELDLDLTVDFASRTLRGTAAWSLDNPSGATTLVLDTRDLAIERVTLDGGGETPFELGAPDPVLGRALEITIAPDTRSVEIAYATSPAAAALQWLAPAQTAGGRHPFLFSQSQAILARTWVPCQDTPGVRFPYRATVRVPPELMALMSAANPRQKSADGVYRFAMPQPIPSYLLALAVGDLDFAALGERSGVYAEPAQLEAAAAEFTDLPQMIAAAERLFGPYRWERYDLLVLPPSFPFGGMENPRLTFVTPTILAGDRSLVSLVAHELAHSWSGNLVTNATWDDFWLNEGVTTYIEYRIMEELYGVERADMLRVLGRQDLLREMETLDPGDTRLTLDLAGRDPDDGMNNVAYEKGAALLARLEELAGRERFDAFLRAYFDDWAFRSLDSEIFAARVERELELGDAIDLDAWIAAPGLPVDAPAHESPELARVEAELERWRDGASAASLDTANWSTQHWLHFLRHLPKEEQVARLAELDAAFDLSSSGNSEILAAWFTHAIDAGYDAVRPALRDFLLRVGRRKFLRPLYAALATTPEGLAWAREVYREARPGYHAVSTGTVDQILELDGG